MTHFRWMLIVITMLGCRGTDPAELRTIVLSIQGQVVSAQSDDPIGGAQVRLGRSDQFSVPVTVMSTTADANGNFSISREVQHVAGQCGFWVGASAPGYASSDPASNIAAVQCQSQLQTVQVKLLPQTRPSSR